MKKLMVAIALGALALGSTATAQNLEPMDIGIFGDNAGAVASVSMIPGTQMTYYVVSGEMPGIKAFSFNLNHPTTGFVVGERFFGPGPLDVESGDKNRAVVGTGGCIDAAGDATLAEFDFFPTGDNTGHVMCLTGDQTSDTGFAEMAMCDDTIVAYGFAQTASYGDGCNQVNGAEAPVSTELNSFGGVKAGF